MKKDNHIKYSLDLIFKKQLHREAQISNKTTKDSLKFIAQIKGETGDLGALGVCVLGGSNMDICFIVTH